MEALIITFPFTAKNADNGVTVKIVLLLQIISKFLIGLKPRLTTGILIENNNPFLNLLNRS